MERVEGRSHLFAPSTNYIRTAHCASCSRSVRGTVLECDVCRILVHPACAPNTLHNCQSLTPIPALLPPLPFHSHPALAPFDLNAPPGGRSKGSTAEEGLEPSAMQGGLTATLKEVTAAGVKAPKAAVKEPKRTGPGPRTKGKRPTESTVAPQDDYDPSLSLLALTGHHWASRPRSKSSSAPKTCHVCMENHSKEHPQASWVTCSKCGAIAHVPCADTLAQHPSLAPSIEQSAQALLALPPSPRSSSPVMNGHGSQTSPVSPSPLLRANSVASSVSGDPDNMTSPPGSPPPVPRHPAGPLCRAPYWVPAFKAPATPSSSPVAPDLLSSPASSNGNAGSNNAPTSDQFLRLPERSPDGASTSAPPSPRKPASVPTLAVPSGLGPDLGAGAGSIAIQHSPRRSAAAAGRVQSGTRTPAHPPTAKTKEESKKPTLAPVPSLPKFQWDGVRPPWPGVVPLVALVNPKSGGGKGYKLMTKLRSVLGPHLVWDLMASKGPNQALDMFIGTPGLRLIVAGGDGTINWVLDALNSYPSHLHPPIATIPFGTGNDTSRVLGWGNGLWHARARTVLEAAAKAPVTGLDRWEFTIKFPDVGGRHGGSLPPEVRDSLPFNPSVDKKKTFNNYFSIGWDGRVTVHFEDLRTDHPKWFCSPTMNKILYLPGICRTMCTRQIHTADLLSLRVDGKDIDIPRATKSLLLNNIPSWASGNEPWARTGRPGRQLRRSVSSNIYGQTLTGVQSINDGLIEVMGLRSISTAGAMMAGAPLVIPLAQGHKVEVFIDPPRQTYPVWFQADGEGWMDNRGRMVMTVEHAGRVPVLLHPTSKVLSTAGPFHRLEDEAHLAPPPQVMIHPDTAASEVSNQPLSGPSPVDQPRSPVESLMDDVMASVVKGAE